MTTFNSLVNIKAARTACRRFEATFKGQGPRYFQDVQILVVWHRDSYKCINCGSDHRLTVDHIKPWYLGGETRIKNAQTLCKPCNWDKFREDGSK